MVLKLFISAIAVTSLKESKDALCQLPRNKMSDKQNTNFPRKCIYCEYYMYHSNQHLCFYGNLADIFLNGARTTEPTNTCKRFLLMHALQANTEKQK